MWKLKINELWWQKDKNFWEQIVRCPITKPYGKELKISFSKKVNTKKHLQIFWKIFFEMQRDFSILFIFILSTTFNYFLFSPYLIFDYFFLFFFSPPFQKQKNIFIPTLRSVPFLNLFFFFLYFCNFFTLSFLCLID